MYVRVPTCTQFADERFWLNNKPNKFPETATNKVGWEKGESVGRVKRSSTQKLHWGIFPAKMHEKQRKIAAYNQPNKYMRTKKERKKERAKKKNDGLQHSKPSPSLATHRPWTCLSMWNKSSLHKLYRRVASDACASWCGVVWCVRAFSSGFQCRTSCRIDDALFENAYINLKPMACHFSAGLWRWTMAKCDNGIYNICMWMGHIGWLSSEAAVRWLKNNIVWKVLSYWLYFLTKIFGRWS